MDAGLMPGEEMGPLVEKLKTSLDKTRLDLREALDEKANMSLELETAREELESVRARAREDREEAEEREEELEKELEGLRRAREARTGDSLQVMNVTRDLKHALADRRQPAGHERDAGPQ